MVSGFTRGPRTNNQVNKVSELAKRPSNRARHIISLLRSTCTEVSTNFQIYFHGNLYSSRCKFTCMEISKVMFSRVCGFQLRVWESCRSPRSFGYGYGSATELTEVPSIVARAYRTHRSSGQVQTMLFPYPGYCGKGRTELTEVPGTGMSVQQNSRKLRVWVWKSFRTCRSSGYCGTGVHNLLKFRAGIEMLYPYPGYCGTVVQILHKFRVRV